MDYELALELKKAGFPQGNTKIGTLWYVNKEKEVICFGGGYECDCFTAYDVKNPYTREIIKCPTLSELIEACGYSFRSLSLHSDGRWISKSGARATGGKSKLFTGHTAEEAIAKLYLELNKK